MTGEYCRFRELSNRHGAGIGRREHRPIRDAGRVTAWLWRAKILRDYPELAPHLRDVLRAVAAPELVVGDLLYEDRRRHYLRDAGPSRWLVVVVGYEQEPARVITAFGSRKDPRSWSK